MKATLDNHFDFSQSSVTDLVTMFNREVLQRGWTSMRAWRDQALINQFICRGIDVSCVYDGHAISFAHHVRYDSAANRLETTD